MMENSTINPAPPSLTGLVWRPITRNDLEPLVDLAGTCFLVDGGLHFMLEPENLTSNYFPDAPGTAIGAFAPDQSLVACTTVHLGGNSGEQRAVIVGQVRPDLRNQGIGTYLMQWSQEQAQTLLAAVTTDQWLLQIRTESLIASAHQLYLAHGFRTVDEQLVMRCDLHPPIPDCPFPSDVTFTDWDPALADQFFQAYDAAFRERPGFPGYTAAEWVDSWTTDRFRPEWSLLARVGDEPLGFLTATANPPHGFIMQVGVIPSQRRRGLASALMVETMRRMQAANAVSVQLTVRVNNPGAIQTYAQLGFVTIGRRARYERIVER
jgi:mycothiol synthase